MFSIAKIIHFIYIAMLFIDFLSHVPSSHRPIKHLPNTKIVRIDFYNNYIIITINIGTFPRPHHLNGTMGRWDAGRTLLASDEK